MSAVYIALYKLMEEIDGEHRIKLIPYKYAQRIKCFCLLHII